MTEKQTIVRMSGLFLFCLGRGRMNGGKQSDASEGDGDYYAVAG